MQRMLLMEVLWDTLYGSFVFVPLELSGKPTVQQGQVTDSSGRPARGQRVDLQIGGRTFHTFTDRSGGYRFVGAKKTFASVPTGTLTVKGKKQKVSLFSTETTVIRLQ